MPSNQKHLCEKVWVEADIPQVIVYHILALTEGSSILFAFVPQKLYIWFHTSVEDQITSTMEAKLSWLAL